MLGWVGGGAMLDVMETLSAVMKELRETVSMGRDILHDASGIRDGML